MNRYVILSTMQHKRLAHQSRTQEIVWMHRLHFPVYLPFNGASKLVLLASLLHDLFAQILKVRNMFVLFKIINILCKKRNEQQIIKTDIFVQDNDCLFSQRCWNISLSAFYQGIVRWRMTKLFIFWLASRLQHEHQVFKLSVRYRWKCWNHEQMINLSKFEQTFHKTLTMLPWNKSLI